MDEKITYKSSGVDIEAGERFVNLIRDEVRSTFRSEVIGDIGGFGGLFNFQSGRYVDPVLVSGSDGVGTKLKVAFMADRHDTVGIDLVAMSVNDIVVTGAEPLFFLDYLATGRLVPEKQADIVKGIAEGCRQAGCALIGGETAEMPGFYSAGEYDLAGFAVGVVDRQNIIDGSSIEPGDAIVGLASSGLHSNGYSLARRVFFDKLGLKIDSRIEELGCTVADELLKPTRIYVKTVLSLIEEFKVKGLAHITGGGITGNLPRIIPEGMTARINRKAWVPPAVFAFIQGGAQVDDMEMLNDFNMGIGMIAVVGPDEADGLVSSAARLGEKAFILGEIVEGEGGVEYVG